MEQTPQVSYGLIESIENIKMPVIENTSISSGESPYSGGEFEFSGDYPETSLTYEVISEVNGQKTLVVNVYPVQYNPETEIATITGEFTFTFAKTEAAPDPLVNLEVKRSFDPESGRMLLIIKNTGVMDAANVQVVETLPDGVSVDSSSLGDGGGCFISNLF